MGTWNLMSDAGSLTKRVVDMLTEHVDDALLPLGFTRRASSRVYRRKLAAGHHTIDFHTSGYRKAGPGAIHVDPHADVVFPAVNRLAEQIKGEPQLFGGGKYTRRGDLQRLVPAGNRFWVIRDESELFGHGPVFRKHLEKWMLPWLELYTSVEDLARVGRDGDEPVFSRADDGLVLAAANILADEPRAAAEIIERHYGADSPYLAQI